MHLCSVFRYELLQKGMLNEEDVRVVPDIYVKYADCLFYVTVSCAYNFYRLSYFEVETFQIDVCIHVHI